MIGDLERRLIELRFLDGVQKVEHVPYSTGDEFWVRFSKPLDLARINEIAGNHGCTVVRFANLPSKLPRPLAEMLWDGVTHVITKKISGWSRFTSSLGVEPDGIAKIASDMHGPYEIFIATQEEGIQMLYEYLELKYVPPPPPAPKPVAAAKPAVPAARPPVPAAAKPSVAQPAQPTSAAPQTSAQKPTSGQSAPAVSATVNPTATSPPQSATQPAQPPTGSPGPPKKEEKKPA